MVRRRCKSHARMSKLPHNKRPLFINVCPFLSFFSLSLKGLQKVLNRRRCMDESSLYLVVEKQNRSATNAVTIS